MVFIFACLQLLVSAITVAHPGSGIVVDERGQVYFTDTGKGIWKIAADGKLTYLPASAFHWMAMDATGQHAAAPKRFGEYFEQVKPPSSRATLITCSDFPLAIGKDQIIYYANTRPGSGKIVRRTREGTESVVASHREFDSINGIAVGLDGSLYITEANNPDANTIRKVTMDGTVSIMATYTAKSSRGAPLETTPSYCRGLSVDSTGTVYVAATGSRCVLKITPQGKLTTVLQTPGPWTPTGVAVSRGEIYVLEWHDVPAEKLEVRSAWIPRVRKIGRDGKVTILATIAR